jgi:lysozyme
MADMDLTVLAQIVKRFEGLHKVATRTPTVTVIPYVCPAGILTIGYGHTKNVKRGQVITLLEAEGLLQKDLKIAVASALSLSPVLAVTSETKLLAIADFIFNLGAGRYKASTLRRRVNQQDWDEAAYELGRWVWGGGKKLPGLVARRAAEIALILHDDEEARSAG